MADVSGYGNVLGACAVTLMALQVVWRFLPRQRKSFNGQVVWITGASRGLGRELALSFARAGARVILSARTQDKLKAVAEECAAVSPRRDAQPGDIVQILPLDLATAMVDVHAHGARANAMFNAHGVDILVNNGGVSSRSDALSTTLETDMRVMAINFMSPVALTKAVLPGMVQRGGGHIVVISSVQGKFGLPYRSSYAASKHALHGYFDSLRSEVASANVGVTTICPGYIATDLSLNALRGDGSAHGAMDATTAAGMDPARLAADILTAVAEGQHERSAAGCPRALPCSSMGISSACCSGSWSDERAS